ncbi:MAG: diguanylate cyclase [Planctomycetota bacterium]
MTTVAIHEMYVGETSEIISFDGDNREIKRLRDMGIREGKLIDLIYYDPILSNKIVIGVDNTRIAFDANVAYNIKVRPIKSHYETFKVKALYDPLTQCFNRNATEHIIRDEYEKFINNKIPMSLLFADIDYFKRINDTYGHQEGDSVLKAVADLLKQGLRRSDVLCRWGGEEFLILLRGTRIQEAAQIAERLRQKVESHQFPLFLPFEQSGLVTISIGCAELLPRTQIAQLIEKADNALYTAKNNGRNKVVVC